MVFGNYDSWRNTPYFRLTHLKQIAPGIGISVVIVGVLVLGDVMYSWNNLKLDKKHGDSSHKTH